MSPTLSGIHEALRVLLYGAMIPTPGFHHVHLNSVDPDAAIDFYVRQFPTPGSPSCEARGAVQDSMIYHEVHGSGYPLLHFAPGGLRSAARVLARVSPSNPGAPRRG